MDMVITAVLRVDPESSAQSVLDWLEREAQRAGHHIRIAQVLPYDPPREVDTASTELGDPEA